MNEQANRERTFLSEREREKKNSIREREKLRLRERERDKETLEVTSEHFKVMDTGLDRSFPLDITEQVTTWDARVIGCTSDSEGVRKEEREREMEKNVMICLIRLNGSNCSSLSFPNHELITYFHTYSEGPPSLALRIHLDISWNVL